VRAAIEKGIAALKAAGCTVKPVSLPHTLRRSDVYYLIATAEASANLARFDGVRYGPRSKDSATLADMYRHSREEGFGAEVKRRILLGTYALSAGYYDAYYLKAQQVRRCWPRSICAPLPRWTRLSRPPRPCRPSSWAKRPATRWPCIWPTSTR
jgi:aspartyl-tRNA(Asn)/glutamyl-tRNA(Gln) amidotransferase subunit A